MPSKPKSNDQNPERNLFGTPSYAIPPIIPYLPPGCTIWESAAGEGLLADALEIYGFTVIRSDILTGQNYFDDRCVPNDYAVEITNVPFSLKYRWIETAYRRGKPFCLLMPSDTLFAARAQRLFQRFGWSMLIPSQRIDFKTPHKGWDSSAQMNTSWFLWGLESPEGVNFVTLDKPKKHGYIPTDREMIEFSTRAVAQQTALF